MHALRRSGRIALVSLAAVCGAVLSAAPQTVLVLGDSLSEEYAFELPFSAPNSAPTEANIANWVEILAATRADEISFGPYEGHLAYYADYRNGGHAFNWAVPGFRTTDLVELLAPPLLPRTPEQLLDAISLPRLKSHLQNDVAWAVVFCAGNDLSSLYTELATGAATAADLAAIRDNLAATVDFVRAQNPATKIVLVNAPDIGVTPSVKGRVPLPALRTVASARIGDLNTLLAELATARGIALADIFSITRTLDGSEPLLLDGVPLHKTGDPENRPQFLFAKDGFHASTAAQALVANAILGAMNTHYGARFTPLSNHEILETVLGLVPPAIATQPQSTGVVAGQAASLNLAATGADDLRWFKNGVSLPGATAASLALPAVGSADAGIYDCLLTGPGGSTLSAPVVLGVVPAPGQRTAGAVTTRAEWQDINHPNGAIYDQFLLTGAAGTFTADPKQIARCSYLDENDSIVQVEMSGAGAITIVLDPATAAGPMAPALYSQSGIQYMKGKATVILAGADETTHFTIYSVGTATNPGVTRPDAPYVGWASVAAAGVVSVDGKLGGIHQGNVAYNAALGYAGLCAPTVGTVGSVVVVHDIAARDTARPYLYFGAGGAVQVKIAGASLAQPNGEAVTVSGLASVAMGAGQDSCGRSATAQPIATRLETDGGTDLTAALVTGP